jgi:hypothetical protein
MVKARNPSNSEHSILLEHWIITLLDWKRILLLFCNPKYMFTAVRASYTHHSSPKLHVGIHLVLVSYTEHALDGNKKVGVKANGKIC